MFRRLAVFPGPFTLNAAEAVAGTAAEPAVLHLVDCSLLVPPRTGPDGRARYVMLETLRAYGLERLAEAGERPRLLRHWPAIRCRWPSRPRPGSKPVPGKWPPRSC